MIELMFWGALAVWIIFLFASVKSEESWLGIVPTIAYLCLLEFFFKVNLFAYVYHHWLFCLAAVVGFFGAGTLWSIFRWIQLVREGINKFKDMKIQWLMAKGQTEFKNIPSELQEDWAKFLDEKPSEYGVAGNMRVRKELAKPPLVRNNKAKILRWISMWPISVALWVFEDMLRGVAKSIYEYLHDWLQSIANSMYKNAIGKDLPENFK